MVGLQVQHFNSWSRTTWKSSSYIFLLKPLLLVQNTTSREGQIKQLVYSMENAIRNLPPDQEQMVWLIDLENWTMNKATPVKTTQETAHVLQNHYPERLGIAILYNPPRIFETFWQVSNNKLHPFLFESLWIPFTRECQWCLYPQFDMYGIYVS